jgi:hypothetical protein
MEEITRMYILEPSEKNLSFMTFERWNRLSVFGISISMGLKFLSSISFAFFSDSLILLYSYPISCVLWNMVVKSSSWGFLDIIKETIKLLLVGVFVPAFIVVLWIFANRFEILSPSWFLSVHRHCFTVMLLYRLVSLFDQDKLLCCWGRFIDVRMVESC